MVQKRKVILVTDGDMVARGAVQQAAANVGARCISQSAGNPTPLSGEELVNLVKQAVCDPVVIMLDDRGSPGAGRGERALAVIARHPDIEVLGVLAVASNTCGAEGVEVDESVTCTGSVVRAPVDKLGEIKNGAGGKLNGDTVDVLNDLSIPVVVGIGDIGKMDGADDITAGAPLTTRALREIIDRSGFNGSGSRA
ncbi:MAG: stage V sporulation protein AE [Bacillota bacterium]|jgi:stage V sporulation protein AE